MTHSDVFTLTHLLMSVYVQSESVNSTAILHEEAESLLTPGQIATITISTTFAFYITVMFAVCMGEYCQYKKGRKRKMEVRRKRHSGNTQSAGNQDSDKRSGSLFDSSFIQSDYTSSFQARQSGRLEPVPTTSKVQASVQSCSNDTKVSKGLQTGESNDEIVTIPFEENLSSVHVDCDNPCENGRHDIVMLPLIPRQCDDILDTDGEIFCDSNDSKEMYRLEADV